ncbi:MAG: flavodoxin [Phycisphaerae bacterium]|jgi:flavodoxin
MKTLVVYYSRSGITRTVAQAIAAALGADLEEIIDTKDRSGALGYLAAGRDAMKRKPADIQPPQKDPAAYDRVILGTPVWAFTMTPAIRAYVERFRGGLKRVAFFCTQGGSGDQRTFAHLAELTGLQAEATLTVLEKEVKAGTHAAKVSEFVAALPAT